MGISRSGGARHCGALCNTTFTGPLLLRALWGMEFRRKNMAFYCFLEQAFLQIRPITLSARLKKIPQVDR